jgi:hypothetical protein
MCVNSWDQEFSYGSLEFNFFREPAEFWQIPLRRLDLLPWSVSPVRVIMQVCAKVARLGRG